MNRLELLGNHCEMWMAREELVSSFARALELERGSKGGLTILGLDACRASVSSSRLNDGGEAREGWADACVRFAGCVAGWEGGAAAAHSARPMRAESTGVPQGAASPPRAAA
jgi:hypothetical protein